MFSGSTWLISYILFYSLKPSISFSAYNISLLEIFIYILIHVDIFFFMLLNSAVIADVKSCLLIPTYGLSQDQSLENVFSLENESYSPIYMQVILSYIVDIMQVTS